MSDLVCLVADKSMEAVIQALLPRFQALQIREITFDTIVHYQRDPGCFQTGADLLLEVSKYHDHGLIVLDHAWEGCPAQNAPSLVEMVRTKLNQKALLGWADVVVIDPELEVWLFANSPRLEQAIGWRDQHTPIRQWLNLQGHWPPNLAKPPDPKRAMELVFKEAHTPRSSSVYRLIAARATFQNCVDETFLRLRGILSQWFAE